MFATLAQLFLTFLLLGLFLFATLAQLFLTFFFLGLFQRATLSLLFSPLFFLFFITCAASAVWPASAVSFSFRLFFGGILANHE